MCNRCATRVEDTGHDDTRRVSRRCISERPGYLEVLEGIQTPMDSILYNNETILPTLEEAEAISREILLGS
jgi:hypothetical protein